jgi:hypothetical protein
MEPKPKLKLAVKGKGTKFLVAGQSSLSNFTKPTTPAAMVQEHEDSNPYEEPKPVVAKKLGRPPLGLALGLGVGLLKVPKVPKVPTGKAERFNWFAAPPLLLMILKEVIKFRSVSRAVTSLQERFPGDGSEAGLFDKLAVSTVRYWYEPLVEGALPVLTAKARASIARESGAYRPPASGQKATLGEGKQHIVAQIIGMLTAMRAKGVALNAVIVRAIITATLEKECPEVLAANGGTLAVGRTWVAQFMHQQLHWSYRSVPCACMRCVSAMRMHALCHAHACTAIGAEGSWQMRACVCVCVCVADARVCACVSAADACVCAPAFEHG